MTTALVVGLLSGVGAVARVTITDALSAAGRLPRHRATLLLNVAGAFALGLLTGADVTGDALLYAGVAFLGSLTTFSTWMADEARLVRAGDRAEAGRLVVASIVLGLAAAGGGWALAAVLS